MASKHNGRKEWVHHNDAGQPLYYGDGYFLNTDNPKSEFKGKYKLAKDTKNNALRQIEYEGEYIKNARTGEEI